MIKVFFLMMVLLLAPSCCGQLQQAVQIHAVSTNNVATTISKATGQIDCTGRPACTSAVRIINDQAVVLRSSATQLAASAGSTAPAPHSATAPSPAPSGAAPPPVPAPMSVPPPGPSAPQPAPTPIPSPAGA